MSALPAAGIPHAMQNAPRWLLWRALPGGRKPRKVPFYCNGAPRNGTLDSPEDRAQLATLPVALAVLQAGGYTGLGFALGPDGTGGHWQGVDLDNLPGRPELRALALPSYTETSPSGTGRHAIGYGRTFSTLGSNTSGIEAYAAGRYFTVTGVDPAGDLCDLADFVESQLAPMHGGAAHTRTLRPPVMPTEPAEPVTPEVLLDLYGALLSMPSEDRGLWVGMGLALKSLGDDGRDLWLAWSACCPEKFDPDDADATWQSFRPERTGYKAVFAEAQRRGWNNPAAGARAAEVFGQSAPAGAVPTPAPSRAVARPVSGTAILDLAGQQALFTGHAYVLDAHRIACPDGTLASKEQFDAWHGGYQYVMDPTNGKLSSSAWEAFTASRLYRWPKVHHAAFRPALPAGAIWSAGGRDYVNTYCPILTPRTAGDPAPFLDLLRRILPVERDRAILLAYLAFCLQYPGLKAQWCVMIQGVEGNGKSFLNECMAHAIGRRHCHSPKASEVTGKFNSWAYGILMVLVEDIFTPSHRSEVMEILKPMITNSHLEIEAKGQDKRTVEICCNFLLNSNHKDGVRKTQNDRRLAVFYCAQQAPEDLLRDGLTEKYFRDLYDWARTGGFAVVNNYLREYQIPDALNPAVDAQRAPATSSTSEACRASLGAVEQEVLNAVESERVGFRGGWISTHYLDALLREIGAERSVPRNKRRDMLRALGYAPHPGLAATDGRVNNPVAPEGVKSRLYVSCPHDSESIREPARVGEAYTLAQGEAPPVSAPVLAFARPGSDTARKTPTARG